MISAAAINISEEAPTLIVAAGATSAEGRDDTLVKNTGP